MSLNKNGTIVTLEDTIVISALDERSDSPTDHYYIELNESYDACQNVDLSGERNEKMDLQLSEEENAETNLNPVFFDDNNINLLEATIDSSSHFSDFSDDSQNDPNFEPLEYNIEFETNLNAFDQSVSSPQSELDQTDAHRCKNTLLLPPCKNECRKKCALKFNNTQRQQIFNNYYNRGFAERRLFLDKYVAEFKTATQTACINPFKRNYTVRYSLPKENCSNPVQVCKTMFLHTLGKKSDKFIVCHRRSKATKGFVHIKDCRGIELSRIRKIKAAELESSLQIFINSYNPVLSHYNLNHAPNRRYFPPGLTIRFLYTEYIKKHERISYETFRKIFARQNIGFSTPFQDKCTTCSLQEQHCKEAHEDNNNVDEYELCDECVGYQYHRMRYRAARQKYQEDCSKDNINKKICIFAVDMQKVLIIPKMPIKNAFFVSRLIVMNETFASLNTGYNKYVLWHEGICGRNAANVSSTYLKIIQLADPEVTQFNFWADNCSAQNKNWTLYTMFVKVVNEEWGPEKIVMKYFEPGHSFMKCDALHGQIAKKWRQTEQILDMNDVVKTIKMADKRAEVIFMHTTDFKILSNGVKARRKNYTVVPLLNEIRYVEFRKGSRILFYKTCLTEDVLKECDFLKKCYNDNIDISVDTNRGVNKKKLNNIKEKLLKHMPSRKRIFWNELDENEVVDDMGNTIEESFM